MFDTLLSNYLLVNLYLLPAIIVYLFLIVSQGPEKTIYRIHKGIVLVLFFMPLIVTFMSLSPKYYGEKDFIETFNSTVNINTELRPIFTSTNLAKYPGDEITSADGSILHFIYAAGSLLYATLSSIFVIGLLILALRLIKQQITLRKLRQNAEVKTSNDGYEIIRSNRITNAFSTHLLFRKIYLPLTINENQFSIILSHEVNHFRNYHHWWLLLETIMTHIYWFNPLSHMCKYRGELMREYECDDATINETDKFQYGLTLVEMAQHQCQPAKSQILVHAWIGKNTLRKRVERILGKRNSTPYKAVKVTFLVISTFSLGIFFYYNNLNNNLLETFVVHKMESTLVEQQDNAINISQVPQHFIDLLLTVQDKRYFSHDGVDNLAFGAASTRYVGWKLFNLDTSSYGGSTITMQAAKNFILIHRDRSIANKLQQVKVAKILEKQYSKEQILAVYLSGIYWGPNKTWGLRQAAQIYYQKPYTELSLEESAMLIQMIPSPNSYNPLNNSEIAEKRQNDLIKRYLKTT